ncbi:MAG: S8 family peptidase [Arenicella sp.]
MRKITKINLVTINLSTLFLLSGCATSIDSFCKKYNIGRNVLNVVPNDSGPSAKPMKGIVAQGPLVIEFIKNLENTDMVLSYTPIGGTTITATIAANSTSNSFKGLFASGQVSIERQQAFITERGDGADIEVCFSEPIANSDTPDPGPVDVPAGDANVDKIPFAAVGVPAAWTHFRQRWQTKTPNTTGWPAVLVVDDGFFHHPDLPIRPDLFPGFESSNSEGKLSPPPVFGFHGTGVASIISATRNNNIGISGIAGPFLRADGSLYGGVELLPARAEGKFLGGSLGMDAGNLAKAITYWLSNPRLRVINISQSVIDIARNDELYTAFKQAQNKGVLIVIGAGNDRKTRNSRGVGDWMAGFNNIIIVGGLNNAGTQLWVEDNQTGTATGTAIDIWAPADNLQAIISPTKVEKVSGTSFATPMVSAVAALVLNLKPSYSAHNVRDVLLRSAKTITLSNGSSVKRLDAYRALQLAERP